MEDLQSPLSEPSAQSSNVPTTSRRNTSATRKASVDEIHINSVMKMGFQRRIVELAIRTLSKFKREIFIFLQSQATYHSQILIFQSKNLFQLSLGVLLNGSSSTLKNVSLTLTDYPNMTRKPKACQML